MNKLLNINSFFAFVPPGFLEISETGVEGAFGFSSIYVFFIVLFFHVPFIVLSFFYAVNGSKYEKERSKNLNIILLALMVINILLLGIPIFKNLYFYPSLILLAIPCIYFFLGYKGAKTPIFNWILSVAYAVTVTFFLIGGYNNYEGFGPKEGEHKIFYTETADKIKSTINYKYGLKHGVMTHYYPNGQEKQVMHYTYDTLQGIAKEYYDNGTLKMTCEFENNKIHGTYQSYFKNGQTESLLNFVHDILHGPQKTYHPNGQLSSYFHYNNGKEDSLCTEFHANGQLKSSCHFINQKGEYKAYYDNGQLKEIGQRKGRNKIGLWKYYHRNGQLAETGYYLDGDYAKSIKQGLWKTYYENGQLETIGEYEQGIRKGKWKKYFDTGEQSDEHDYN